MATEPKAATVFMGIFLERNGLAYTKQFVALPGCSEHQLGLAIDVGLKGSQDDLICPRFRDSAAADCYPGNDELWVYFTLSRRQTGNYRDWL